MFDLDPTGGARQWASLTVVSGSPCFLFFVPIITTATAINRESLAMRTCVFYFHFGIFGSTEPLLSRREWCAVLYIATASRRDATMVALQDCFSDAEGSGGSSLCETKGNTDSNRNNATFR